MIWYRYSTAYVHVLQFSLSELSDQLIQYFWACSQCSAPKHITFNPTFPRKQKLFSREGKDLVIFPLLQEICKDKMKGLLC